MLPPSRARTQGHVRQVVAACSLVRTRTVPRQIRYRIVRSVPRCHAGGSCARDSAQLPHRRASTWAQIRPHAPSSPGSTWLGTTCSASVADLGTTLSCHACQIRHINACSGADGAPAAPPSRSRSLRIYAGSSPAVSCTWASVRPRTTTSWGCARPARPLSARLLSAWWVSYARRPPSRASGSTVT